MAEESASRGEEIRVDRIYERSRIEETVLASTYELLVPTQRWVPHRQGAIPARSDRSSCGGPIQFEEESWRGFGS